MYIYKYRIYMCEFTVYRRVHFRVVCNYNHRGEVEWNVVLQLFRILRTHSDTYHDGETFFPPSSVIFFTCARKNYNFVNATSSPRSYCSVGR